MTRSMYVDHEVISQVPISKAINLVTRQTTSKLGGLQNKTKECFYSSCHMILNVPGNDQPTVRTETIKLILDNCQICRGWKPMIVR